MPINWISLIIALALCQGAGILGSFFTISSIPQWYAHIAKPSFAPPNWIFGPVWTTLYLLMGIALYLVLEQGEEQARTIALWVFGLQLLLNAAWSPIFFGLHNPGAAFIELVCMWLSIIATIYFFYALSPTAALLLVPYLAWVSFAGFLNYSIWALNS